MPNRSNSGKISSLRDDGCVGDETKAEPTGPTVDVKTLHERFFSAALGKTGLLGGKE